jgi:hypothetical protein
VVHPVAADPHHAAPPLAPGRLARYRNPLPPTREAMHTLASFPIVNGGKARRERAHEPRPIHETFTDLDQPVPAMAAVASRSQR